MNRILIFLSFLLLVSPLHATGENPLVLDKESWEELTRNIDYTDDFNDEEAPQRKQPSGFGFDLDPEFWRPVFFTFIIILALWVSYLILKKSKLPAKVHKERAEATSIEDAEENLPDVALDQIFTDALKRNDYKAALRIKFLMVLQQMIDQEIIKWKKRKTNEQYISEISTIAIKRSFAGLVKVYDDVWYGGAQVSEPLFAQTTHRIEELNAKIHGERQE